MTQETTGAPWRCRWPRREAAWCVRGGNIGGQAGAAAGEADKCIPACVNETGCGGDDVLTKGVRQRREVLGM